MDAHAFIAVEDAVTHNHELERAAYHLRLTSLYYEEGRASIDLIINNQHSGQKELRKRLTLIAEVLGRTGESERNASEILRERVKALQSVYE